MSLIRWNPARDRGSWPSEVSDVQREMNRLFDNFFRTGWQDDHTSLSVWTPAADVAERENEFHVAIELPGVEKNDISITLESNVLTIRGTKKTEKEEEGREYHRVERRYGSFHRSFSLPAPVQAEKINATFKDGMLNITLPKAEDAKPKQIAVTVQ